MRAKHKSGDYHSKLIILNISWSGLRDSSPHMSQGPLDYDRQCNKQRRSRLENIWKEGLIGSPITGSHITQAVVVKGTIQTHTLKVVQALVPEAINTTCHSIWSRFAISMRNLSFICLLEINYWSWHNTYDFKLVINNYSKYFFDIKIAILNKLRWPRRVI